MVPGAFIEDWPKDPCAEEGERARLTFIVLGNCLILMRGCDTMYKNMGKFSTIASKVRVDPLFHLMVSPCQCHKVHRLVGLGPCLAGRVLGRFQ